MGFCPYFLQEKSSGGISASLLLIAGTLNDLFILSFLHIIKEDSRKKEKTHRKRTIISVYKQMNCSYIRNFLAKGQILQISHHGFVQ